MSFVTDHSGRLFTAGKKKCSLKDLARNDVIFATMEGHSKPRQSAHLLAAAILGFYDSEKLFPPGLRSDMECVQQWSLRMGDAIKKMEPKATSPADDESEDDSVDGHGDCSDLSVLGSSSAAASSSGSAVPSTRTDSLLSRLASQLHKCKLSQGDASTKAPSSPGSGLSVRSILSRVQKNKMQESPTYVPDVFAGNGKNSGKVVTDLPDYVQHGLLKLRSERAPEPVAVSEQYLAAYANDDDDQDDDGDVEASPSGGGAKKADVPRSGVLTSFMHKRVPEADKGPAVPTKPAGKKELKKRRVNQDGPAAPANYTPHLYAERRVHFIQQARADGMSLRQAQEAWNDSDAKDREFLELFAGQMAVTKALRAVPRHAFVESPWTFSWTRGRWISCSQQSGHGGNPTTATRVTGGDSSRLPIVFLNVATLACLDLAAKLSRWSSGRSLIRLWGYKDREFVASGNKLSSRVALLLYLCQWRNVRWLLEQPDGSMLPHLPRFQQFWRKYDVYHSYFWMGKFNGPTPKRHRIWSNCFDLVDGIQKRAGHMLKSEMKRLTKRLVHRYDDKLGTRRFTGKRKELRDSQILG
ncbi:unnamed protein product [Symbiodinium sp. CCMP2592]|nr:unnamed protein product [Symbiodinium sp. CCMP2592]